MNTQHDKKSIRFQTPYGLDQIMQKQAEICMMHGVAFEQNISGDGESYRQEALVVLEDLKKNQSLWEQATGEKWKLRGFVEGSLFYYEHVLKASYARELPSLLEASIAGVTIDSMIRRRERKSSRMSARWQMAGVQ